MHYTSTNSGFFKTEGEKWNGLAHSTELKSVEEDCLFLWAWGSILCWFALDFWPKMTEPPGYQYFLKNFSMRNKNNLWQHLIVTINKVSSAALQPFAFLRPFCICKHLNLFLWTVKLTQHFQTSHEGQLKKPSTKIFEISLWLMQEICKHDRAGMSSTCCLMLSMQTNESKLTFCWH